MPKFLSYQRPRPVKPGNWGKAPPPSPKASRPRGTISAPPSLSAPPGKPKP